MFSLHAMPFVPGRVQGTLRRGAETASQGDILQLRQGEIAHLSGQPAGIIVVDGAPFSHPTLRLLGRGIPTVLAEAQQLEGLHEGMELFLDGRTGLLASPVPPDIGNVAEPPIPQSGQPIPTADGVPIELRASIGSAAGAATALTRGATAIGLVRSEYLFPEDGRRPDAAFLTAAFAQLCEAARPLRVTFRLLDIAGDKRPPWLGELPELAGVLGLQGARLFDIEPVRGVFLDELKALREVAGHHALSVLLPYVVSLTELEALHAELRQHLPATVPIGTMLETPAAALAVREFLDVADFAALGCNDLMQCLFAADRDLPELRVYLEPYAPVIYRFLDGVARSAGPAASKIQVCGLLSQLPGVLPALIGLGYRAFSVDPVMIPWLAETVRQTHTREATRLAKTVCEARRPNEVRRRLLEGHSTPMA